MKDQPYENFPAWMALVGAGVTVAIYVIGAYILSGFGVLVWVPYLVYCGFVEILVLRGSCVHCFYYGKVCGMGRGKLCSLLFRRGDPRKFVERQVSAWDIMPDLLVPAVPTIGGMVLLLRQFDWVLAIALALLVLLASAGTALVRGSIACRHCAQKELGCPAEKLFDRQSRPRADT